MKILSIIKTLMFLSVLLVIIWSINSFVNQSSKPSFVRKITNVKRMDIEEKISVVGNVEPEKKIIITAPFDGYVQKLYVKIGDSVRKNAPIVSITETLQPFGEVYPIRVPFAGTVVHVIKKEGEFVTKNNTENYLVRIDKLDKLYVEFDVPELYRLKIKPGQKAIVKISAILNKLYKGVVKDISLAAKHQVNWRYNENVEFLSQVEILDIDGDIQPGMSAIVDIISSEKKQVLAVPHEFIFQKDESYFAVMQDDTEKPVKIGIQTEAYFEITEGLQEGDRVKQIDLMDIL